MGHLTTLNLLIEPKLIISPKGRANKRVSINISNVVPKPSKRLKVTSPNIIQYLITPSKGRKQMLTAFTCFNYNYSLLVSQCKFIFCCEINQSAVCFEFSHKFVDFCSKVRTFSATDTVFFTCKFICYCKIRVT